MIAGEHKLVALMLVVDASGRHALQMTLESGKWSHLLIAPSVAASLREHLSLPVQAAEPVFKGTQEPVRQLPACIRYPHG